MKSVIVLLLWICSVVDATSKVNSIEITLKFSPITGKYTPFPEKATANLSADQNEVSQVTPDQSQNVSASTIWIITPWNTLRNYYPRYLQNSEKVRIVCENNGTAVVDGAPRSIEAVTLKSCFLVERNKAKKVKEEADIVGVVKSQTGAEFIVMKLRDGVRFPSDRYTRYGFISFSVVQ